jgi:hypothetical protein
MTTGPTAASDAVPDRDTADVAALAGGWRSVRPELIITAVMVIATAIAAYAYVGLTAAFASVTFWAVVILLLLRWLVPVSPARVAVDEEWQVRGQASYLGFWRQRGVLADAAASMRSYDADLRPTLQHLLAARLAERHGVSLYADPEAARRLLLAGKPDDRLWFWLDPQRPPEQRSMRHGIPQRTLTAIVERLERL